MQDYFDKDWIKKSDYPKDFIPANAEIIVGVDMAKDGRDCTVKGFYDPASGEYHVQEVLHNAKLNGAESVQFECLVRHRR
jgi:hypothetical protein